MTLISINKMLPSFKDAHPSLVVVEICLMLSVKYLFIIPKVTLPSGLHLWKCQSKREFYIQYISLLRTFGCDPTNTSSTILPLVSCPSTWQFASKMMNIWLHQTSSTLNTTMSICIHFTFRLLATRNGEFIPLEDSI